MNKLGNYSQGQWHTGHEEGTALYDAIDGSIVAIADSSGLDTKAMLSYGRSIGTKALTQMSFYQRGVMLKKLALHLSARKETYYQLSFRTGATRVDSWIDIEGGFGNLFANASLRKSFPDQSHAIDGDPIDLSRGGQFMGHHILVPKRGVAIHINAYNFPVWGMLEKCAVNWMAGVAAIVKPATSTSYLTELVVRDIIASGILPEGALQLICGSARDLLDHVESQDVVTFTGSATTGRMLRAHPRIIEESVPFNMEADSLNASVLGLNAAPGSPEFDIFIKEVKKEMTVKCGQKCTAIRRILVPEAYLEDVSIQLSKELQKVKIGHPLSEGVRMGALASKDQVKEVQERVALLTQSAQWVYGQGDNLDLIGADAAKGAFMSPSLLIEHNPFQNLGVHDIEAFGPVSTIMPYKNTDEAIELTKLGKGSLCCSLISRDGAETHDFVIGAASHHGRILVLNRDSAKESTGHGSPLPSLVHGGPGRAGGGEEMGGIRGVKHYMQRCAIQGSPTSITQITGVYQAGATPVDSPMHPFRYHYEDIKPGVSVLTHKRTITDSDIQNFANLTWDVFYAHTDVTSLDGSIFRQRAAHGYFLLAAAAGLFVSPAKGPVGANYGLEDCRFIRPVYHNDTIQVRLTCMEKIGRDSSGPEHPAGIVKWLVEIFDEEMDKIAFATILTLVQKKSPFIDVDFNTIERYINQLTESHQAKWGIMTPQHMVEHLESSCLVALGKIPIDIITPPEMIQKYQDSLWNYKAMPVNFQNPILRSGQTEDLIHPDLATAKLAFLKAYKETIQVGKENKEATFRNAVFGDLDRYHWQLLSRKHFHHHFAQFGLV